MQIPPHCYQPDWDLGFLQEFTVDTESYQEPNRTYVATLGILLCSSDLQVELSKLAIYDLRHFSI